MKCLIGSKQLIVIGNLPFLFMQTIIMHNSRIDLIGLPGLEIGCRSFSKNACTYWRYGFNLGSRQLPSEFLHEWDIAGLCRLYVKEGKAGRLFPNHQIGHGLQPNVIWLRHENISLWNLDPTQPLIERPRPI